MSSEYLKEGSKKNPNFQTVYPLPLKQQENVNYSHKEVIYKYMSRWVYGIYTNLKNKLIKLEMLKSCKTNFHAINWDCFVVPRPPHDQ